MTNGGIEKEKIKILEKKYKDLILKFEQIISESKSLRDDIHAVIREKKIARISNKIHND